MRDYYNAIAGIILSSLGIALNTFVLLFALMNDKVNLMVWGMVGLILGVIGLLIALMLASN